MCGRFTLKQAAQTLQEMFELSEVPMLPLRYNIALRDPANLILSIRMHRLVPIDRSAPT